MYIKNEKWAVKTVKKVVAIISINPHIGLAQCIIGDQKRSYTSNKPIYKEKPPHVINAQQIQIQKRRYIEIIDIWCSCLVVWYYIFIWLLVLFGRCCTFFHLQGAFLRVQNYFRKIGACVKKGGRVISSLKSKFQHRGGLSFAFLCLFSCMVVYMVLLKQQRFICRVCSSCFIGAALPY